MHAKSCWKHVKGKITSNVIACCFSIIIFPIVEIYVKLVKLVIIIL